METKEIFIKFKNKIMYKIRTILSYLELISYYLVFNNYHDCKLKTFIGLIFVKNFDCHLVWIQITELLTLISQCYNLFITPALGYLVS